ncbi:MAG: hypothetical protein QM504_03430 [Pseudomonadota bacterium]
MKPSFKSALFGIFKSLEPNIIDYSDLSTPIDKHTFLTDGGVLGTVFDYRGMRNEPISKNQYSNMISYLSGYLGSYFKSREHELDFVMEIDTSPHNVKKRVDEYFLPNIRSMHNTSLGFQELFAAKSDLLKDICSLFESYFVVWTAPFLKNKDDEVILYPSSSKGPRGRYSNTLLSKHLAFIQTIESAFNRSNFECRMLNVQHGISRIRGAYNAMETPSNYKPILFPKTILSSDPKKNEKTDLGFVLPPLLKKQISPGRIEIKGFNEVSIGNRQYSSVEIERFPAENKGFDELIEKLILTKLPVRISMKISGGGEKHPVITAKKAYAYLSNGRVRKSLRDMEKYVKNGGVVVGLQSTVSTWVDLRNNNINKDNVDAMLRRNTEQLIYALQGWGSTDVKTKGADAVEQYTNNIPGFRHNNTAPLSVPKVGDALYSLPLYKMSTIWDNSIDSLFCNSVGQIIPFKRFSKEQNNNCILISGSPGAGKSVLHNGLILSLACHPGLKSLPYLGIVDIKPSSFGALTMIRDELPDGLKHQIVMSRIENTLNCCINPHDTYYGARQPTKTQHTFIKEFWSLVTQDVQSPTQDNDVVIFLGAVITEAFRMLSDESLNSEPRPYNPAENKTIEQWVQDSGYKLEADTTYWDLFDHFHALKEYRKAARIQKLAMPTLSDLISACSSSNLVTEFKNAKVKNQSEIIVSVTNILNDVLKSYPALSSYTRLDFSDARMISLDIQPVANNSTYHTAHQTAIFYMLSMNIVTRNFMFEPGLLNQRHGDKLIIGNDYQGYHNKIMTQLKGVPKGVYLDEFHMTSMINQPKERQPFFTTITRNLIASMIRVNARVENIEFIIISQNPRDFDDDLRSLYTTGIIMGAAEEDVNNVCEIFGLKDEYKARLPYLGNPGPTGSNFIMVIKTKRHNYIYSLYNPTPGVELWGTSTTNEDVEIREILYSKMNSPDARRLLAKHFPGGSARNHLDKMDAEQSVITKDPRPTTELLAEKLLNTVKGEHISL